ncbi:MAG: hypothetical protein QGG50_07365 [Methanopyri archaeon]|nr:hypothetical protein [Methanopyri archaeon]
MMDDATTALVLGVLTLLTGCQRSPSGSDAEATAAHFEISDGQGLVEVDTNTSEEDTNATITLVGRIEDTGALNLFRTYRLAEDHALSRQYYLTDRVYKDPHGSTWVRLTCQRAGTLHSGPALRASSFEPVPGLNASLERAVQNACAHVEANRKDFDLNLYKGTKRFKAALTEHVDKDLNTLPFEPRSEVVLVDNDVRTAGIDCGRVVLHSGPVRGDFLSFLAVYDLEAERVERVFVRNTGYFME